MAVGSLVPSERRVLRLRSPPRADSLLSSCSKPRIITADTQIGNRQVPAALNVPFGNLFFGYDVKPPPGSADEQAEQAKRDAEAQAATAPFAGVGSGNTLSGRTRRAQASTPGGAAPPTAASASSSSNPASASSLTNENKPIVPFSGSGHSLSGKKTPEVIEID